MLGMDQGQRSNAVGFNTAYLPDGEGARHGGGTYTGQATEPTIQDYENFFGPSARDIKTDLQRFKRHGRWHLPDILQGPNPWLTDRIDGLITDATNSPFTTKILPYRYKEEVDGKIKWNVWSFDEGMASRVPYESAARTLTQSKRSFAGYMVRQGMAIVLEHNFMMTPKGRENFKNQLNQLIGSIQYTNDLDVHMALILAPSYQKTMRERYYTTDKSPAQICREFADLFGMMQKNVNALDILIEEGKAILRTWGGPMPDFLLCNSKLTFQMTMTPEKTNYITQGIDGVKRLRQGPDLGSYRGLSVIHSRAFAMETGQHPRDVLRRRVRTAEYYRILPSKKNATREFEFYNEERDTWFTLSFHDLLKYARHLHDDRGSDNASLVDGIYHRLSAGAAGPEARMGLGLGMHALGARYEVEHVADQGAYTNLMQRIQTDLQGDQPLVSLGGALCVDIKPGSKTQWYYRGFTDNLGITIIQPKNNQVWDDFKGYPSGPNVPPALRKTVLGLGPMNARMLENLFMALKGQGLNDPFAPGSVAAPGTGEWFAAYDFYLEIFQRGGVPFSYLENLPAVVDWARVEALGWRDPRNQALVMDVTAQYLGFGNNAGSVNHPFHVTPGLSLGRRFQRLLQSRKQSAGSVMAQRALLCVDILVPLLATYNVQGRHMQGVDVCLFRANDTTIQFEDELRSITQKYSVLDGLLGYSITFNQKMLTLINRMLSGLERVDHGASDGELMARAGVSTIPLYHTSMTHLFHQCLTQDNPRLQEVAGLRAGSHGHLSLNMLESLLRHKTEINAEMRRQLLVSHPWIQDEPTDIEWDLQVPGNAAEPFGIANYPAACQDIMVVISNRLRLSPVDEVIAATGAPAARLPLMTFFGDIDFQRRVVARMNAIAVLGNYNPIAGIVPDMSTLNAVVDWNLFFEPSSPYPRDSRVLGPSDLSHVENVELVIVRPNIEHNMLGVIMGLGGESLGNTLWGQTELSVYDDSMHGIWGMSYKYHERAIVFNEKNLIRMWDIAYDGYNGGKDDTYVNWLDEGDETSKTGPQAFQRATLDVSTNYRGPSMMVMAFVHDRSKVDDSGRNVYDQHFRRNWPSPIVFYDTYSSRAGPQAQEALPIDYDNVQTVNVEDFRVFNNVLYEEPYARYKNLMPEFRTMHMSRKTAGQSSADAETATDCLAFQGSMRIKEGGAMIQEIQGSGHHGPDYVGIASVRAGKGQKVAGQAPAPYRLV